MITEVEKEVRENLAILNEINKKINIVRNELIPYYGKECTLEKLEELLWNQYTKYNNLIHKSFEMCELIKNKIRQNDNGK